MKTPIRILIVVTFPLLFISPVRAAKSESTPPRTPRTEAAVAAWQQYQSALRDSSEERARACWTETSRRYRIFNWHLPFDQAVTEARQDSLKISDAKDCGKYVSLRITSPHWTDTAWGGPAGHTYYVIDAPRPLLAAPFEVLTDGWQVRETPHFVLHYTKHGGLRDEEAEALEAFYDRTSSTLGVGLDRRIDYFRCDSSEAVGAILDSGPAPARSGHENRIIAAINWTSFHEVVHVLLGPTCTRQPNSPIFEGAACYFGGATLVTQEAQLAWAKCLVENGEAMPLTTFLDESGFWSAEDMADPYSQAAAFTGFLIDRYGGATYKKLYRFREETDTLQVALEKITGQKMPELETDWKDWVSHLELPAIGLRLDDRATEIFRMEDPPSDDTGDGRFAYPLAADYRPGMFDLTGFRVLSDDKRVYFELSYRDLVAWPETGAWGFGGTFTRIAIDCGGQGDEGVFRFDWTKKAKLGGHWDYLISVSDCGVVVVRGDRIVASLKRLPPGERLGDAELDRIRFSIPCSEPEASRKAWRYAVAVGGVAYCSEHFKNAAGDFLAVTEHATERTGGGGSADGTNPNIYDILLPTGQDQAQKLARRPVVIPMVGE